MSPFMSEIVHGYVADCLENETIPVVYGGDHSLTLPAYLATVGKYGALDLVVFDAHHDSYEDFAVNHYSLFFHIRRLYEPRIYWFGVRKDAAQLGPRPSGPEGGKAYLSIDVDFFSPGVVPSVMDPIDDVGECTFERFRELLWSFPSEIVAADIVEWFGASSTTAEYQLMTRLHHEVEARLQA
jgi:arginase family enzyme